MISGIFGCLLCGLFIDKTQRHLLAIRFVSVGLTIVYLLGLYFIPIGNLFVTCGFGFMVGVLNVPILPSTYAYATKLGVNVPSAVVNGIMMSGA